MTTKGIPGNPPGRQRFYESTPEEADFERHCEAGLDLLHPQSIRALSNIAPSTECQKEFWSFADDLEAWLNKD